MGALPKAQPPPRHDEVPPFRCENSQPEAHSRSRGSN